MRKTILFLSIFTLMSVLIGGIDAIANSYGYCFDIGRSPTASINQPVPCINSNTLSNFKYSNTTHRVEVSCGGDTGNQTVDSMVYASWFRGTKDRRLQLYNYSTDCDIDQNWISGNFNARVILITDANYVKSKGHYLETCALCINNNEWCKHRIRTGTYIE